MDTYLSLLKGVCWLGVCLCLLGLWRPWLLLWFLDQQNRLRVLIYYGIPTLLAAVVLWYMAG